MVSSSLEGSKDLLKPDILQIGPYASHEVTALEKCFTLHPLFAAADADRYVADRAERIRGIATRGDLTVTGDLIRSLPNLEVIAIYGVGYDGVDLDAAREANVGVSNTPDVLTGDVADLGIAMMLCASRGILAAEQWVKTGKWENQGPFPLKNRVFGKRAGILGLGRIGRELAKRCAAFSMSIAYCDTERCNDDHGWTYYSNPVDLAENVDFLLISATGGEANRYLVNRDVIKALGSKGMLINISRASNIDEDALLQALECGDLGFAALDVFENEPALNPRFLTLENVLLQPHHASGTVETRADMARLLFENLDAHFSGSGLITPVIERK